jgi:hypothetical protein
MMGRAKLLAPGFSEEVGPAALVQSRVLDTSS